MVVLNGVKDLDENFECCCCYEHLLSAERLHCIYMKQNIQISASVQLKLDL